MQVLARPVPIGFSFFSFRVNIYEGQTDPVLSVAVEGSTWSVEAGQTRAAIARLSAETADRSGLVRCAELSTIQSYRYSSDFTDSLTLFFDGSEV
jgi:hypothetical protein